jgi:hypothetical protein
MHSHFRILGSGVLSLVVLAAHPCWGQDSASSAPGNPPSWDPQPAPKGVQVMARGPVHEAFASAATPAAPTNPVPKEPPKPIDEMPPAEKPEGNAIWIGGYWAWEDDKNDFLWVSGTWRVVPPGKHWVAGYWREDSGQWRWVPGFWTTPQVQQAGSEQQVTYMPQPPEDPRTAPPGEPPGADSFYVPGSWVWHNAGYVEVNGAMSYRDGGYSWVPGYWARVQPGYVWVPAHYRWTPSGYIYVPGYWDYALAQRGFLYAPVVVDTVVVGPGFVYTPAYVVSSSVLIDCMWIRPCYCHYYFGDYYGGVYAGWGFESCVVYSRRCYEPIFFYARWENRYDPHWEVARLEVYRGRVAGTLAPPPRVAVGVGVGVGGVAVGASLVVPAARASAVLSVRTVPVTPAAQIAARQQAQFVRQVAVQRAHTEVSHGAGPVTGPRTAALAMPPGHTFGQPPQAQRAYQAPSGQRGVQPPGQKGMQPPGRPPLPTRQLSKPVPPSQHRQPEHEHH